MIVQAFPLSGIGTDQLAQIASPRTERQSTCGLQDDAFGGVVKGVKAMSKAVAIAKSQGSLASGLCEENGSSISNLRQRTTSRIGRR